MLMLLSDRRLCPECGMTTTPTQLLRLPFNLSTTTQPNIE